MTICFACGARILTGNSMRWYTEWICFRGSEADCGAEAGKSISSMPIRPTASRNSSYRTVSPISPRSRRKTGSLYSAGAVLIIPEQMVPNGHSFQTPCTEVHLYMAFLIVFIQLKTCLQLAPQGRTRPLSVTGSPSSLLSARPPKRLEKMLSLT